MLLSRSASVLCTIAVLARTSFASPIAPTSPAPDLSNLDSMPPTLPLGNDTVEHLAERKFRLEPLTFADLGAFSDNLKITAWAWGKNNADVVQSVPDSAWTSGVAGSTNGPSLRILYPKGSYSPTHSPIGGVGLYNNPMDVTGATNLSFAYSIFFPKGFDFVKGGKLPGLYGGAKACSGGSEAENCFSTRMMWRTGGAGELYLYAPRAKQVDALCTLPPLSFCNSVYGMTIGRGSWYFKTGEWTQLRQDIWLNTPGKADGGFNIWVNGDLVLHSDSVYYRNSAAGKLANGTADNPIPLFDYEDLPDTVEIPNGGFITDPTSTLNSTGTPEETGSEGTASDDWEVRKYRRNLGPRASVSSLTKLVAKSVKKLRRVTAYEDEEKADLERRASSGVPIGFLGMKFDTFFGGSTVSYAPKQNMYTYINTIGLRIRS
ncbi:alginate lyase, polysaccharide lyase family 14 protein [Pseudohyphozyma bogoriensis]|nr:alginate lyase, polysaccharide lyase family 14 protein [Pseudohyphozyma bogoriensis]